MFVLQMIGDRRIKQVECETSDDITVVAAKDGVEYPEYIQVKTTDKDTKWTQTEVVSRPDTKRPTSLIEKSLLCDKHGPGAKFRIVTKRGVNKGLEELMIPLAKRDRQRIADLADKLNRKHSATLSERGNNLAYWVKNAIWDVFATTDHVETRNLQMVSRLAEEAGSNPTYSNVKQIYTDLLSKVDAAAVASRRNMAEKTITREDALVWWNQQITLSNQSQTANAKPYRRRGDRFFVQIHEFKEDASKRGSTAYDAQYDLKVWRAAKLARYLADWVPEVSLRASELPEIDQLNLRSKLEAGFRAIASEHPVNVERLLGETMLHAVLRHFFGSEPIACKLFHRSALGDRVTRNAHIVPSTDGDQLWLGRTHLFRGTDFEELTSAAASELSSTINADVLTEEREIILHLREPQHLVRNDLGDALERGAPLDELVKILCLPLLIASLFGQAENKGNPAGEWWSVFVPLGTFSLAALEGSNS
ncbi:DUF4297 domain-containing protein [Rhizobium leguminosarum]|nr:DUF4297 domain-containing protein [Rhizobium leguminosarum]MBY5856394.1 DUF4297 domain-containing protein [Rhizobium leguminosarum]